MAQPPTIIRIEPLGRRALRVRLHLDRGEPIEIALEALERSRLGLGDPLPSNVRHHLLAEDADVRVREAAHNLLSYRQRTRAELRRRLVQKGHRPARVDRCLEELAERGLLDDAAVAAAFVRDRLRHRPRGPARLRSELRALGVEAGTADRVIEDVLDEEGVEEAGLAREVALAWLRRQGDTMRDALARGGRGPDATKAHRRLRGYLGRRGFAGAPLVAAMEAARSAAASGRSPD